MFHFPNGNQLLGESIGIYREYMEICFFLVDPLSKSKYGPKHWDFIPCQDCHGVSGGEYEHGMEWRGDLDYVTSRS